MITAIRVEASMASRDARFAYQRDNHEGWGAFFIQDDGEGGPYSFWEIPEQGGGAEVIEDGLTWNQAISMWNESAASIVRDMDPDHLFTGPQVSRITGMAKSSISHTTKILGFGDIPKLGGRTNIYTRDQLAAIFERNITAGRPVGGNKRLTEKIRKALEEDPNILPERWKKLVSDHYGLNGPPKSLRELSDYDGVTPERIRQIIAEALSRIIGYRKITRVKKQEATAYARRRRNMSVLELFEDDQQRGRKIVLGDTRSETPDPEVDGAFRV